MGRDVVLVDGWALVRLDSLEMLSSALPNLVSCRYVGKTEDSFNDAFFE